MRECIFLFMLYLNSLRYFDGQYLGSFSYYYSHCNRGFLGDVSDGGGSGGCDDGRGNDLYGTRGVNELRYASFVIFV